MAVFHDLPIVLIIAAGAILAVSTGKLTFMGAIAAAAVGFLVFAGDGYSGFMMLVAFFLAAAMATSWKKRDKLRFKAKADRSTRRNAGQVLANGGVAALSGLMALWMPQHASLFHLMIAAAISSATADTLSSELGIIYGRWFFNIVSLKRENKGLDGVISVTGTMIGIAGSAMIAFIYCLGLSKTFWLIILAGTIGNFSDSILGATFERKGRIGNNAVNFSNTLIAALFIWLCRLLLRF
jgi:uncharacterized protein (TIGR00297 family)